MSDMRGEVKGRKEGKNNGNNEITKAARGEVVAE
jgi:hypothetical protein